MVELTCLKAGCDKRALKTGNYCADHRPKARMKTRKKVAKKKAKKRR